MGFGNRRSCSNVGYSLYIFVEECGKQNILVNIHCLDRELNGLLPDHESQVSPNKAKSIVGGYTSFGPVLCRNVDC